MSSHTAKAPRPFNLRKYYSLLLSVKQELVSASQSAGCRRKIAARAVDGILGFLLNNPIVPPAYGASDRDEAESLVLKMAIM